MTAKGIIFTGAMVRALHAGRKTQTRRLLKLPTKTHSGGPIYERPDMGGWAKTTHGGAGCFTLDRAGNRLPVPEVEGLWHQTTGTCFVPPYRIGERLYVREAAAIASIFTDVAEVRYAAHQRASHTEFVEQIPVDQIGSATATWPKYRPSIHMPRAWSRLWLGVTDVRVDRLQDISEADAEAEGFPGEPGAAICASEWYSGLWNTLHTTEGTRWADNPWVFALTFDVHHGNIDGGAA